MKICLRSFSLASVLSLSLISGSAVAQSTSNTSYGAGGALSHITTGTDNSAFGFETLYWITTGSSNTAIGSAAMGGSVNPTANTAVGLLSLECNGGSNNTAIGANSGDNNCSGSNNIFIGYKSGTAGGTSNNIDIGNIGVNRDSGVIRIGSAAQTSTFIAGINGATSSSGSQVYVNSSGQLGTFTSSLRFKEDVQDMGDATNRVLLRLRPVTFHYKAPYDDGSHLLEYGLIAEEVAKVAPGLVQYDEEGKPYSVRYQFLNTMLLNEVQAQHRQLASQQAQIEELQNQVKALLEHTK
jgi:hypothetical protein